MTAEQKRSSTITPLLIGAQIVAIVWLAMALRYSNQDLKAQRESVDNLQKAIKREVSGHWLSLNEVLSWRNIYAKSIDSHKSFAIDQLGEPSSQNRFMLYWKPSEKTKQRRVYIRLNGNTVVSVQVMPHDNEKLYFVDALQKPQQFDFKMEQPDYDDDPDNDSGTLIVTKRDGSAVLTFGISSNFHRFLWIEFR